MKPIMELEKTIAKYGFSYGETVNIQYQGMTRCYAQTNKNTDQSFRLRLWQDNQGGDQFWVMELSSCVDLEPGNKLWHPMASLSIEPILEETIDRIPQFLTMLAYSRQQIVKVLED